MTINQDEHDLLVEKLDILEIFMPVKVYSKTHVDWLVDKVRNSSVPHKGVVITGCYPWIMELMK